MYSTRTYNWMMSFTEKLLEKICIEVNGKQKYRLVTRLLVSRLHSVVCLSSMQSREKTGFDLYGKTEEEIRHIAVNELKLEEIDESFGKGKLIDEIFGEFCEGTYIQPTSSLTIQLRCHH